MERAKLTGRRSRLSSPGILGTARAAHDTLRSVLVFLFQKKKKEQLRLLFGHGMTQITRFLRRAHLLSKNSVIAPVQHSWWDSSLMSMRRCEYAIISTDLARFNHSESASTVHGSLFATDCASQYMVVTAGLQLLDDSMCMHCEW